MKKKDVRNENILFKRRNVANEDTKSILLLALLTFQKGIKGIVAQMSNEVLRDANIVVL